MEVKMDLLPSITSSVKTGSSQSIPRDEMKDKLKENGENLMLSPAQTTSHATSIDTNWVSVPPATPVSVFYFENHFGQISLPFPKVDDIKFPYIREVGIKGCIEILSDYFNCKDYKLNSLQFWFLDVITDCLWKMQDEFQFPERYQKIIVEWILYVFDLIRDPQKNLSRKEFFQIFNEAMIITNEKIQTGCEILPSPSESFNFTQELDAEISFPISTPSKSEPSSNISIEPESTTQNSLMAIGNIDESTDFFKLPTKQPCKNYEYLYPSNSLSDKLVQEDIITNAEEESDDISMKFLEFYKPDPNIPSRFLPSKTSLSSSNLSSSSSSLSSESEDDELKILHWKDSSIPSPKKLCMTDIFMNTFHNSSVNLVEKENSKLFKTGSISKANGNEIKEEWVKYIKNRKDYIVGMEKNILINSCALSAIKDFVYDYFYETFQYTLAKFAFINTFNSITQNINNIWNVPKILKEELKKPKPKKEKKKKKKKPKKKSKKTKRKGKKEKKKSKKKSKKSKEKKSKKSKKKLTKEEKAEIARLKREQKLLEEARLRDEENRRLLFPLIKATDDDFFKSIFEKWVKPKGKKKGGKGGKKNKKKNEHSDVLSTI